MNLGKTFTYIIGGDMTKFIDWLFRDEVIIWLIAFNAIVSIIMMNWMASLGWIACFGAHVQIMSLKSKI